MPYNEYFNYANCVQGGGHYNYYDCEQAHSNYFNQGTHYNYDNHGDWGTCKFHSQYINSCTQSYTNYSDCEMYEDYTNHINYTNPDIGDPITLTWTSPWTGDTLTSTYIAESIEGLKELRDNVEYLSNNKSQQSASVDFDDANDDTFDDTAPINELVLDGSLSGQGNDQHEIETTTGEATIFNINDIIEIFDSADPLNDGNYRVLNIVDGHIIVLDKTYNTLNSAVETGSGTVRNLTTPEKVDDAQFNAIRDSLENLWQAIRAQGAGVGQNAEGDEVLRSEWESLKTQSDALAAYDDPNYSNHVNTTDPHTDYSNYGNA